MSRVVAPHTSPVDPVYAPGPQTGDFTAASPPRNSQESRAARRAQADAWYAQTLAEAAARGAR